MLFPGCRKGKNMHWRKLSAVCLAAITLCGCSAYTQTTSGRDWLSAYQASPVNENTSDDIDARVRQAGAVEPMLRFPARIGIARIGQANFQPALVAMSQDEALDWVGVKARLGESFGEFVPISPLIAAMMEPDIKVAPIDRVGAARHLLDTIRLAAARQHLDAILIYEVDATTDQKSNPLRFADWTILGAFVVPSQDVKAVGVAQAMLIDVRNGYPYGQVTSSVDDKAQTALFYSGEAKASLTHTVEEAAVLKLTGGSEGMIRKLKDELTARRPS
jgi:hypothetical protein